jgi:hypothetical protein
MAIATKKEPANAAMVPVVPEPIRGASTAESAAPAPHSDVIADVNISVVDHPKVKERPLLITVGENGPTLMEINNKSANLQAAERIRLDATHDKIRIAVESAMKGKT